MGNRQFSDATRVLFHRAARDRVDLSFLHFSWDTIYGEGEETTAIIAREAYLDGAVIYAEDARAWQAVWAFVEKFHGRPLLIVAPGQADANDWFRAGSRPGALILPDLGFCARKLRYLFKYKLHAGVFHRSFHVMAEKDLGAREAQCLLLRGAEASDKVIAERLGIGGQSVRAYLQSAAKKMGDNSVPAMVARLQQEAREEARKNPLDPDLLIGPWRP